MDLRRESTTTTLLTSIIPNDIPNLVYTDECCYTLHVRSLSSWQKTTAVYNAEINGSQGEVASLCTSTAEFIQLWLREHCRRWGRKIGRVKRKEVCCETASPRNNYLDKTETTPLSTNILHRRGQLHRVHALTRSYRQVMTAERGRISLSQVQAPDWKVPSAK